MFCIPSDLIYGTHDLLMGDPGRNLFHPLKRSPEPCRCICFLCLAAPTVTLLLHLTYRNWNYSPGIHLVLPPLGRESLKSPSVVSQVLPSPPHTRHRSSFASEPRMLSQPTCFKKKKTWLQRSQNSNRLMIANQIQNIVISGGGSLLSIFLQPPPPTAVFVSIQHLRTALQAGSLYTSVPWATEIKHHTGFRLEINRQSCPGGARSPYQGFIPIKTCSMLCFCIRTGVMLLAQMLRRHAKRESNCTVRWKSKQTLKVSNQSYFSCVSENTHTQLHTHTVPKWFILMKTKHQLPAPFNKTSFLLCY